LAEGLPVSAEETKVRDQFICSVHVYLKRLHHLVDLDIDGRTVKMDIKEDGV
jgi:hypothetical protein